MNKILMILLVGLFMISFTSALEIDNWVNYENDDLKIRIVNAFNLGEELGSAELKSHKSVNEILKVAPGEKVVTMFYDFDWKHDGDNLGVVEFTNVTSGELINKDYQFVTWEKWQEEVKNYSQNCEDIWNVINNSYSEICERVLVGTYFESREGWVEHNSTTIPTNRKVRIGLETEVNIGDTIDGVWTMAGKKVEKHSVWTADLNVGLVVYYKLDDNATTTLVIDELATNNGTATVNTSTLSTAGKINSAFELVRGSSEYFTSANSIGISGAGNRTISFWAYNDDATNAGFVGWGSAGTGNLFDIRTNAGNYYIAGYGGGFDFATGVAVTTGAWKHHIVTYNGTSYEWYIDNISIGFYTTGSPLATTNSAISVGHTIVDNFYMDGKIDEVGIWSRVLTQQERDDVWNNGAGNTYTNVFESINVTLKLPLNDTAQDNTNVTFNFTINPLAINITNWTLDVWYTNGTLAHEHTNTTINTDEETIIIHSDTLFFDNSYIWNVQSCGTGDICDTSENWTFTIDTTPPTVNITYPPENFIVTVPEENITINYTIEHNGSLSNCYFNTSSNATTINISCTTNTTNTTYPVAAPDNLTIFVYSNDSVGNIGVDNVTVLKDTTVPQIDVESPTGILALNFVGENETLNVTFTDINLDMCWYDYNGTNVTIDGCSSGIKNSTQFILETDNANMTVYANDSFGNENSSFISWDYLFENWNISYTTPLYESTQGVFILNTSLGGGESISEAIFNYNGTNYSTSIVFSGGIYLITSSIVLPSVNIDTNFTFSFFVIVDGITYNFIEETQEVLNIGFINCSGQDLLMNISLFDEGDKTSILGEIELNIQVYSKTSNEVVAEINNTYENISNQEICLSPNASFQNLYIDSEMRYSKDGYAAEFYYIQEADLADYPINLSLFDLNSSDSTEFIVTYKNNAFIFTEGAVIQLQRKYIGEDTYEVVEAPITSDGGKAVLHIDLNSNKYRASVVKDGELLDFFDNIIFSCENELSGDCTYSLDGTVNPNNDVPIEEITDFSYSVSIDEDNQTVTVLFAVPSGTPSTINVALEQIDMFGNLTSCNNTIITSAGSITCDYTDTIEKSILELSISKNDVQLVVLSYANDPDLDMDGMNFFIVFLFMISLVGMAISSPEWMILISVMVLIISGTMLLLKGMSLVMGLGAIAWVIIAAAIIIMKMSKQEDR